MPSVGEEAFEKPHSNHFGSDPADAFGEVDEGHRAIHQEAEGLLATVGHPTEDQCHSNLLQEHHRTVGKAWGHRLFPWPRVSRHVAAAVDPFQRNPEGVLDGEEEDHDSRSNFQRVQESWEALLVGEDTFREVLGQALLAIREEEEEEEEVRVQDIALANPCNQEVHRSLAGDTVAVEACGRDQGAYRPLCVACWRRREDRPSYRAFVRKP